MTFQGLMDVALHLPKSIYFNLHYFPFKVAVKLPVLFLSRVKLVEMGGRIDLKGKVRTGMVLYGSHGNCHYEHTASGCVWANRGGVCVFSEHNSFCKGISIEIGRFGHLELGENVYFGPVVRISCFEKIVINANSRIAWETILMDTDFHSTINTETNQRSKLTKPIIIGRNNWIGTRSMVMKGTQTPDYCIASARSMLNKAYDVPSYSLIGGTPAKFIKEHLFRDLTSNILYNHYIVNADDFGMSNQVNLAIDKCMKEDIISSTTLLANGDAFDEAVELAKTGGYIDKVGMHFNLTEGIPLSEKMKKCERFCRNGIFIYKRNAVMSLSTAEKDAISDEIRMQIAKIKNAGVPLTHLDSHEHVHTEYAIYKLIRNILKEEGIETIRLTTNCLKTSFAKKIYKNWFNRKLVSDGFRTADFFLSYFDDISFREDQKVIEMMIHPKMENDQLVDHVTGEIIQKRRLQKVNYKMLQ